MGEESCPAAKKMPISPARKIPLTNKSFIYSCSHRCCIIFLTSAFMYRYIMLILINRVLLNCICIMTKAFNDQNSSKQISQTPFPPFNAIWKTLIQLLLVLTLLLNVTPHQKIASCPFLPCLTPISPLIEDHILEKSISNSF